MLYLWIKFTILMKQLNFIDTVQSMVIGLTMKNTPSGVANNIGSSVANLKSLEVIMNPECSSQVL
jgi:hypothetical protein